MLCNMASTAVLLLLLLERFLAQDMDSITEPVLIGLRALERNTMQYRKVIFPGDEKPKGNMTKFFLYTPKARTEGKPLVLYDPTSLKDFESKLDTKIIIHGFLDKVDLAIWMHHMKDEFLVFGDFNIIIVDWSSGNFLPYSTAAANTEQVGEEISQLILQLMQHKGARVNSFHLIGHSLGSHVAGYVGEHIKGLKRITGLDPATHLFSNAATTTKLDRADAQFVDVVHSDAGGIGMDEPVGHVDFYPNNGKVQPGCTTSNSLKSMLQLGLVEGVRNIICSHMRAPLLFTDTINSRCRPNAYACQNWGNFTLGKCSGCGANGTKCATMGYHVDTKRNYGNGVKYYLMTSDKAPYCGYEYKVTLNRHNETARSGATQRIRWTSSDILQLTVYGEHRNYDFHIKGQQNGMWQREHVIFSRSPLGDLNGIVIRWKKKPLALANNMGEVMSSVILGGNTEKPTIGAINITPLELPITRRKLSLSSNELCLNIRDRKAKSQQGAIFKSEFC